MQKYRWELPKQDFTGNLVERLIKSRYGEQVDIDHFLRTDFYLSDPFLLPDMKKAVKRIAQAVENSEKIVVFGDYDVDGVTACAVLWELFNFLGIDVQIYIPDRFSEGYGLREASLTGLKEGGANLIITVDCGIRDVDLIRKMSESGLDIIVTDHHSVGDKIPECVAVVNPKRTINQYPETNLAGVGVAFTLARAVLLELGIEDKRREWFEKWNLDLVAIGTVADMMDLTGENRVIVKYGLQVIKKTRKKGILKLLEIAGVGLEQIDSQTIGYVIGPRLNAAGRLDRAMTAFNLLTETEDLELNFLANNLDEHNRKRRLETDNILKELTDRIDLNNLPAVIVQSDHNWSKGVVGLVASRAVEKFNRPVFLAQIAADLVSGSARGIANVNVVEVLDQVSDLLDHYGGHSLAGGFSMNVDNWMEFKERVEKIITKRIKGVDLTKVLRLDQKASLDELNFELWELWPNLHPFGIGNEEPIIYSDGLEVINVQVIGKNKDHLKLDVRQGQNYKKILWWGGIEFMGYLDTGKKYDFAYKLNFNEFRNQKSIDLICVDIKENYE